MHSDVFAHAIPVAPWWVVLGAAVLLAAGCHQSAEGPDHEVVQATCADVERALAELQDGRILVDQAKIDLAVDALASSADRAQPDRGNRLGHEIERLVDAAEDVAGESPVPPEYIEAVRVLSARAEDVAARCEDLGAPIDLPRF
jgi:hypothetical protein